MALVLHWYDSICFGIVVLSILGALYSLRLKEGEKRKGVKSSSSNSKYESLLVSSSLPEDVSVIDDDCTSSRVHIGYSHLSNTCWKGLHPGWLLGFRIFAFLILCGFLAWDIQVWGLSIFCYYTEWTFTLVIIYFAVGSVISAHGCVLYYTKKKKDLAEVEGREELLKDDVEQNIIMSSGNGGGGANNHRELQSQLDEDENTEGAGFWIYIMQTLYQTCAGAVILTDIVFWGVIVPFLSTTHLQVDVMMGSMHTLNAIFLLLDTCLNNLPFEWFRLGYFVIWSCSYVIFQWIIHACGLTWWPYPFLDMSTPAAPFWYFCMAAVHIPCYGIYTLFCKAKNSIFLRCFPHQFMKC